MIEKIDEIIQQSRMAAAEFLFFSQEDTDRVVKAVFEAAFNHRVSLAKMAWEETGIGRWEDKVMKNVVGSQLVYEDIKDEKTVGIISVDEENGITEIAQPMGPIMAIIPVTNPTSTTIFKILICLKSRNPVIICPSRKAKNCCAEAARICYEAALDAGAPEGCIQWISTTTRDFTQALMGHKGLALILATGGGGLVNSAYSSGTPSIGVGAGNVPVYIEKSADVAFAVKQILISKTFDNGTICASEQALVVDKEIESLVKEEFLKNRAFFVEDEDIERLSNAAVYSGTGLMNPEIVGKPAAFIAEMAGIKVPENTTVLIARLKEVNDETPLSKEVLAPVLAFYVAENFDQALRICIELNYHGGIGHSASIFSRDKKIIHTFSYHMNAGRIMVNMPSSQGAVGGIYNRLRASLTLGCGTGGKNITTENISARHLLNIQRITEPRINQRFASVDTAIYLDESQTAEEVQKIYHNIQ
ncbi:MAG: aldehyde dehydrogenase family protein [Bacteroidales bacterium]